MSSPTYESLGFIQDESVFDLSEAHRRFADRFGNIGANVVLAGRTITVTIDGWHLKLSLEDSDYVLEESREIAEALPGCPRAAEIALCRRRIELWSDYDDWEMEHINDYILACEILSGFEGVILWDPGSGELIGPQK